jgi:hypothetical protein
MPFPGGKDAVLIGEKEIRGPGFPLNPWTPTNT